jgi:putative ABC transport system permease protein
MSLVTDLRHGVRVLLKQPGLSVVAVIALTLGIGLTTVMFSIIEGAFLRGLQFTEGDRIVAVTRADTTNPDADRQNVSPHDYAEWAEAQHSLEPFGAYYEGTVNVSGSEGRPERYDGAFITAGAFAVPRVQPLLGRLFVEGDNQPGAPWVAILGYQTWRDRFNGDPDVVGEVLRVNGKPATIIGVMPEGFKYPSSSAIWVPLQQDVLRLKRGEGEYVVPVGRLEKGVTIEEAQAEFAGLARRQAELYPDTNKNVTARVWPYIDRFFGPEVYSTLYTMLGAVFGVMLIACTNVANLLLARTAVRAKEIAVRTALGASRYRVVWQLLLESFLLALVGTVLGLGFAYAGVDLFNRSIVDTDPPFWIDIRLDMTVLLFTAGLTLIATVASGLVPALQASRADVNEILKDEARGSSSLRIGRVSRALVVVEIAVSCGLLVASGLAIKSIINLKTTDYGFATDEVFTARLGLFENDYPDEAARARFFEDLQRRLQTIPGAEAATITSNLPSSGSDGVRFEVEGRTHANEQDYPSSRRVSTAPGFFGVFGRRLLRGRDFTEADGADAPRVAIVNESFAAKFLPGEDPVGRHLRVRQRDGDGPSITIVGLAPDMYMGGIRNRDPEGFYIPLAQNPARFASIAVRAAGEPMTLTGAVRDQVNALDPDLPLYWVRTMRQTIDENNWQYQVFGSLFMAFGFAALFLATVGLYGVMAFSVNRRTQEIGVRMALGANGRRVLQMVLRQGLWQIGIGLAVGVLLAAGLARMITVIMLGVAPWDPAVFATVVAALAAAALLACLIPARRAMRVDPMVALRYE